MVSTTKTLSTTVHHCNHRSKTKPEMQPQHKQSNFLTKITRICCMITVEPILCMYILPLTMSSIAIYNLTVEMACRTNLGLNETICDDLLNDNNTNYEVLVQKEVAKLLVWKRLLSTILPAVLIILMGAYSDRYKIRKPFLLLPVFGDIITTTGFILCTINISTWPMEVEGVFETLFPALCGGLTTMKMAVYSYVSDVSTPNTRTTRLGIVQVASSTMAPLGLFLSGVLLKATGFYGVFSLRLLLFLLSLWYGFVFVREVKREEKVEETHHFCSDFFRIEHVSATFSILVKKKGYKRLQIVALMIAFIVSKGISTGELDMIFLYTRLRFQWDEIALSIYLTYDVLIRLIGSMIGITIFSHWLKLDDLIITSITFLSKIGASLLLAFIPSSGYLFLVSIIGLLSDFQTVPLRSLASKLVTPDDLGKIQSLFGICDFLAPMIYSPLYSTVYRETVEGLPGAFYLVGVASMVPVVLIFLIMYWLQDRPIDEPESFKVKEVPATFRYILPVNELFI